MSSIQLQSSTAGQSIASLKRAVLQSWRRYFCAHGEQLTNLIRLLHGETGAKKAKQLHADALNSAEWSSALLPRLRAINRMLASHPSEFDDEAHIADWTCLDPASEAVMAICWHTDRLAELIDAAEALCLMRRETISPVPARSEVAARS